MYFSLHGAVNDHVQTRRTLVSVSYQRHVLNTEVCSIQDVPLRLALVHDNGTMEGA